VEALWFDLGIAIRKRRLELAMSQSDLARLSATNQQHISLIERGALEPGLKTLRRLLNALGLRISLRPSTPSPGELADRLAALSRFNAWEAAHAASMNFQAALKRAGALAALTRELRRGLPEPAEDWGARARALKERRSRLPRTAP